MSDEELIAKIAHFWSEWTDDSAPLRERGLYSMAAKDFIEKFQVTLRETE
jgi:hypothetical protein